MKGDKENTTQKKNPKKNIIYNVIDECYTAVNNRQILWDLSVAAFF
jgi:hypothetical protein